MPEWIYTIDRLPQESDAGVEGYVIATGAKDGGVGLFTASEIASNPHDHYAWLSMEPMPRMIRIRRTPTELDLAKADRPIPCRVRERDYCEWISSHLVEIRYSFGGIKEFIAGRSDGYQCRSYRFCEIEAEE